jgi:putative peptide zinc metalloprotease protein
MASILLSIHALFKHYELVIIGRVLAAMALFSLFVMPIYKVIQFFWIPGRIYKVKAHRFYTSIVLFIGFLLFLLFFRLPYTVIAPAIVELRTAAAQQVFVPDIKRGNQLREILVVPGQSVQAGDVLAVLENPMHRMEVIEAEGHYRELAQELETLQSMVNYQSTAAHRMGPLQQSLAVARELLQNKQRDAESLVLRAPMAGIVVSPPWKSLQPLPDDQLPQWWGTPLEPQNLGATLESGTVICSIGDPKLLEAILIVDQSRIPFLRRDQRVELKLHEFPDQIFFGQIDEIEQQPVSALTIQLSTRAGGEVPTTTKEGSEEPTRASYRVRMLLDNNPDLSVRVGMTGIGKIHVEQQTLGYRLWLLVNETFNFRL